MILSIAVFSGWFYLQSLFPPPPTPEKKEDEIQFTAWENVTTERTNGYLTAASVAMAMPSANSLAAAINAGLASGSVIDAVKFAEARREELEKQRKIAEQKAKEREKNSKVETVELGDDTFFLKAKLTSRGAGVQKLTLTRFQSADWAGKPVFNRDEDGKKTAAPLDLIPEDPYKASFLMFHYPDPEKEVPSTVLGERVWTLVSNKTDKGETETTQTVIFSTPGPAPYQNLEIRKKYVLKSGWYHVGLSVDIIDNRSEAEKEKQIFRYQLVGAHSTHIEGIWYTYTHRNAMVGLTDGNDYVERTLEMSNRVSLREGGDRVPEASRGDNAIQYAAIATQFFASAIAVDNEQPENGVGMRNVLAYARPTKESEEMRCRLDNFDLEKRTADVTFFELAADQKTVSRRGSRLLLTPAAVRDLEIFDLPAGEECVANVYRTFDGQEVAIGFRYGTKPKDVFNDITVRVVSEPVEVRGGQSKSHDFLLYHGPVKVRQLDILRGDDAVEQDLVAKYSEVLHLDTMTDYPTPGFFGNISKTIGWSWLLINITKIMHNILNFLYWILPVEGLVIILLTVIVRGCLFPMSRKQAQTTMKMQELAPEMKAVKEKYKNSPQEQQQAMMELYRKHGVNPVGSCLPIFLQMPIFLGLYYCLQESIRFRLSSFLWIPNLAAPDMLFYWGQGFPWLTNPDDMGSFLYLGPFLNVLPIIAVVNMIIQQQMMMPPPTDEQQEMQQKMMKYMVVFFGLIFYKIAAGLVIYFIASALWGVAERKLLPKKKADQKVTVPGKTENSAASASTTTAGKPKKAVGKKRGKRGAAPKAEEKPKGFFDQIKDKMEEIRRQAEKK